MILLTGATGFLGRELLGRLLLIHPYEQIAVVVRPERSAGTAPGRIENEASARRRIFQVLDELFGADLAPRFHARLRVVAGDLSEEMFGLGETEFEALSREVHTIYHCAATTALNQELEDARRVNVGGTIQVLRLADLCSRHLREMAVTGSLSDRADGPLRFHLHHVSTAYVAGCAKGTVSPDRLNLDQEFRNEYERSKAESETLVRAMKDSIPLTIYRPSIVVGDSVTGQTSAFNVIYIPARMLLQGIFRFFPALPHVPFDMVPVDYVADSILALSRQTHRLAAQGSIESGRAFHLTSGLGRESSPWEIIELLFNTFNSFNEQRKRAHRAGILPMPALVPSEIMTLAHSSFSTAIKILERMVCDRLNIFKQIVPFIPYMTANPCFDASSTSYALSGDLPPLFKNYAEKIFRYCFETEWGKRPWTLPGDVLPWFERGEIAPALAGLSGLAAPRPGSIITA